MDLGGRPAGGCPLAYPVRLLLVVLLVPFHGARPGPAERGEPVAAAYHADLGCTWGPPMSDQRTGAAIMWSRRRPSGDLPIGVVVWRWMPGR